MKHRGGSVVVWRCLVAAGPGLLTQSEGSGAPCETICKKKIWQRNGALIPLYVQDISQTKLILVAIKSLSLSFPGMNKNHIGIFLHEIKYTHMCSIGVWCCGPEFHGSLPEWATETVPCSDALESKRELNTVKSSSSCCYTFYNGVLVVWSPKLPRNPWARYWKPSLPCLCPHAAGRASSTLPMTLKGTADKKKKRGGTFGQHCFGEQELTWFTFTLNLTTVSLIPTSSLT